jgi:hypothetical protein
MPQAASRGELGRRRNAPVRLIRGARGSGCTRCRAGGTSAACHGPPSGSGPTTAHGPDRREWDPCAGSRLRRRCTTAGLPDPRTRTTSGRERPAASRCRRSPRQTPSLRRGSRSARRTTERDDSTPHGRALLRTRSVTPGAQTDHIYPGVAEASGRSAPPQGSNRASLPERTESTRIATPGTVPAPVRRSAGPDPPVAPHPGRRAGSRPGRDGRACRG